MGRRPSTWLGGDERHGVAWNQSAETFTGVRERCGCGGVCRRRDPLAPASRFVAAGQGTAGLEMMRQAETMGAAFDTVVTPVSGGGLLAGVSQVVKRLSPATEIWGVEPAGFDDLARSLAAGEIVTAVIVPAALLMPRRWRAITLVSAAGSAIGATVMVIVLHHLAFYGPMSDHAAPLMPGLIHWLADPARMVVQVFLVVGGYLAALSLAPEGQLRAPMRVGVRKSSGVPVSRSATRNVSSLCSRVRPTSVSAKTRVTTRWSPGKRSVCEAGAVTASWSRPVHTGGTDIRTDGNAGSCSPIFPFSVPEDGSNSTRLPETDP